MDLLLTILMRYIIRNAVDARVGEKKTKYDARAQRMRAKYGASDEFEDRVRQFILSGEHFDDICEWFAEDFEYVLGADWKKTLRIPPHSMRYAELSDKEARSFSNPANHIYWVYHLILARYGKIDSSVFIIGYSIGGPDEEEMNIRFAERIEKRLQQEKVHVRLVLAREIIYGTYRRALGDLNGAKIEIESLCATPSYRLWE